MLRPEQESLLTTLLELRPDEPAVVVITSSRLTAGAEILDYLSSRFGFQAVDVFEGEPTLSADPRRRRRFIHGLPFLPEANRRRFLAELNRGRDRIETLSNQVVLWLHEHDRSELFSVAPDLAAWVDEVLEWEGELVEREVYSWRTQVPKDKLDLSAHLNASWSRSLGTADVPLVLPRGTHSAISTDRLAVFIDELATRDITLHVVGGDESVEASAGARDVRTSDASDDLVFRVEHDGILFWTGGATELSLHEELDAIINRAQASEPAAMVWSLNSDDLSDVVRTFSSTPASIIHYAGHSSGHGLALRGAHTSVLHPQALRRALGARPRRDPIKLLVLNTSDSVATARALIEPPAVASAVIAADTNLDDRVAVMFARQFYEALFAGQPLRTALASANAAILLSGEHPRDPSPYKLWVSG